MSVSKSGNNVTVSGQVSRFEEYDLIKSASEEIVKAGNNSINIIFADSQSLMSAVIGYLIKLHRVDGVAVSVIAKNDKLYNMLESLALVDILNVRKG